MRLSRIQKLESEIIKHKALYYQGRPEISDVEYDKLEADLRKLDPKNPTLLIVGSTTSASDKIKHDKKMLSLEKTYVLDDLLSWQGDEEILSTMKLDGISCSLVYANGELVLAKTRGDGSFGENITSKTKTCLIHGKDDSVVDFSNFIEAQNILTKLRIPFESHALENLDHSIDIRGINIGKEFITSIIN